MSLNTQGEESEGQTSFKSTDGHCFKSTPHYFTDKGPEWWKYKWENTCISLLKRVSKDYLEDWVLSCRGSTILSLCKHSLSTYCVPSTVLDVWDGTVKKEKKKQSIFYQTITLLDPWTNHQYVNSQNQLLPSLHEASKSSLVKNDFVPHLKFVIDP